MKTENELIEIAKEVILKNRDLGAKLSGSLMLFQMGLNKRRPSTDIDIICEWLGEDRNSDGFPWVPKGFEMNFMDGHRSQVEAMQFTNNDNVKIEFMISEEVGDNIGGIFCAELSGMVLAKLNYAKNDKCDESRSKHIEDLIYLFQNNPNLKIQLKKTKS